jgi:hypothetical protein
VLRGGSFNNNNPDNLRCANRNNNSPDNRNNNNGFRISSTTPETLFPLAGIAVFTEPASEPCAVHDRVPGVVVPFCGAVAKTCAEFGGAGKLCG